MASSASKHLQFGNELIRVRGRQAQEAEQIRRELVVRAAPVARMFARANLLDIALTDPTPDVTPMSLEPRQSWVSLPSLKAKTVLQSSDHRVCVHGKWVCVCVCVCVCVVNWVVKGGEISGDLQETCI